MMGIRFDAETRAALIEELTRAMPAEASFFRSIPEEARRASMTRIVGILIDAFAHGFRAEPVREMAREVFTRRLAQGASLGDMISFLHRFRRIILQRLRQLATGAEEAFDAAEVLCSTCDTLAGVAATVFETQLETTRARLDASYRHFYEATPALAYVINAEGLLTVVSDQWLEALGYARDEVLGRSVLDFVAETNRRNALEVNIPRLVGEGSVRNLPEKFVKKNGELLDVLLSSVIVRDPSGEISYTLTVLVDVTERLRAEQALRESEERYRGIVDLAPVGIVVHRDGRILFANATAARLHGATDPSDLVGKTVLETIHPDDRQTVLDRIRHRREHGGDLPLVVERLVRFDGTSFLAEVTARTIIFDGEPATQVLYTDITEREQSKEALRRAEVQDKLLRAQEETLRALAAPIIPLGDGVVVIPLIGRITAERADTLLTSLAEGVAAQSARVAIIDVTGVPLVDEGVSEALVRTAAAIRLLGARVVLTGVQPAMARTMIERGVELGGIVTRGSLREGIAYATRR
ncbi:PAS domain S-box protein [Polyangium aurulentum]|uniref:PAS domain S-box protein n=1 Tax=Polyangium aurulentum TaxID=2567896 RepID=UPI0010AEC7AA|nr:PAS domain S-box protein [Polyangium aurulentum]UQA59220.1 PAS domain S-box protein [Polyangium aurulentum]